MNAYTVTAGTPGSAVGRMTWNSVRSWPAPSTCAASSRPRGLVRCRAAEQDVRGVEVVERPQEQHQDQHLVDRPEHRQRDVPEPPPEAGAVEVRRLVQLAGDILKAGHGDQERERPRAPNRHDEKRDETVAADQPERLVADQPELIQYLVDQPVVALEQEGPGDHRRIHGQRVGVRNSVRSKARPRNGRCRNTAPARPSSHDSPTDATV